MSVKQTASALPVLFGARRAGAFFILFFFLTILYKLLTSIR